MTERPPTRRNRPTRALALAAVSMLVVLGSGACGGGGSTASDTLPDARFVRLDTGAPASLDRYAGKPLVVNLWSAWCPPCKREMPAIEGVHEAVGDDVAIVGVTEDLDGTSSKKAAAKAGVTYPLLVDKGATFQSDLGITGLPATLFVDADGKIVDRHVGAITATELREGIAKSRASST